MPELGISSMSTKLFALINTLRQCKSEMKHRIISFVVFRSSMSETQISTRNPSVKDPSAPCRPHLTRRPHRAHDPGHSATTVAAHETERWSDEHSNA